MAAGISISHLALASVATHPGGGRSGREWARQVLRQHRLSGLLPGELGSEALERAEAVARQLASSGWRWLALDDPEFPTPLAALSDPPVGIFCKGRLPGSPAVAVVGSRRASPYGKEVAEHLGRGVATAGVWVVSGMARGIDAAAHRGALAAGGPTAAVWGCGSDRIYPPEHAALAEEIAGHGCLLTEYPPGVPPLPFHFPERNRLIAGLVDVVVVVEADERSGALITARAALDEGRDVMAVPGSVYSRLSVGPNSLLRAGAAPALSPADVLEAVGVTASPDEAEEDFFSSALPGGEAMSVDHLAAIVGKPVAEVLEALLRLELSGKVVRQSDGRYRRSGLG